MTDAPTGGTSISLVPLTAQYMVPRIMPDTNKLDPSVIPPTSAAPIGVALEPVPGNPLRLRQMK
jgi:hypothetical protein